jgi:hypothetical protein
VQYFESEFRVELVAADGETRLGIIRSVSQVNTQDTLDEIGTATFTAWAADELAPQITAGSYFKIYTRSDGYLGLYTFKSSRLQERSGIAQLQVTAWRVMIELSRQSVHFNRNYTNHDIAQVVNELVCLAAGWSTSCDAGMGFTAVDYQGESIMNAVEELRKRFRQHYRMQDGFDRRLEFGAFGDASGIRLTGGDAIPSPFQDSNPNIVIVDNLTKAEEGEEVINRIIALGSGQGTAQVTLADSIYVGDYPILTGINPDGSNYYYIEDTDSQDDYGLRERVIVFSAVRPITNTDAGKENAANELHKLAEAHLTKFKEPTVAYSLSTINLPGTLQVGDAVTLVYRGVVDGVNYLDVNEVFFVLSITRNRDADGTRRQRLTISSTSEGIVSDQKVMIDTVRSAEITKLHPQAYPYFNFIPFSHPVGYGGGVIWDATLRFTIDDNVTSIDKVWMKFYVPRIFLGISQEIGVSNQIYFTPSYSNTSLQGLSLWIDGIDVTAEYGGPWSNPAVINEEIDITEKIVGSPFGLYAEHVIYFYSETALNGNVALPGEPIINGDRSFGQINIEVRMRGTCQAILTD